MTHRKKPFKGENKRLEEVNKEPLKENLKELSEGDKEIDKEKQESMDVLFTRDYEQSKQIFRRMIRTGR